LAVDGDFCAESGAAATAELLTRPARRRPTAIVFANDLMAIAGMSAAARLGRRVPDDLSIVGFDDIAVAAFVHPALTTVTQDALAWGRAATRALFDLVEHDVEDDVALPAARLVVRDSTGPIARSAPVRARPSMPGTSSPPAHRSAPSGRSGSTRRKS
jgi:DNA-binding LacI/PurR family transcriptional regulator